LAARSFENIDMVTERQTERRAEASV